MFTLLAQGNDASFLFPSGWVSAAIIFYAQYWFISAPLTAFAMAGAIYLSIQTRRRVRSAKQEIASEVRMLRRQSHNKRSRSALTAPELQ